MPDLACTRCRERKIRCGRERPHCRNCERESGMMCMYRIPAKRVNHLKLLCASIDRLQDRLTTIESHLSRLHGPGIRTPAFEEHEPSQSRSLIDGVSGTSSCDGTDNDEEEHKADVLGAYASGQSEYYFGRPSVAALCESLRKRVAPHTTEAIWQPLCDMLHHLCETISLSEPIPSNSGRLVVPLLPRQQVTAAVDQFFQHQDCQTDVFVPENLRSSLERMYSQHQRQSDDDAWGICFQVITLLARVTSQATHGLPGSFAHPFVPSRAVAVCPGLLTTPRLINVQTLLLLSVAAQAFDYSGSAELIFAHACTLARVMGLHCSEALDQSDIEQVERAKVLRALYVRDRSLYTLRGSVLWMPCDDYDITAQLRATVDQSGKHSNRLHLALVQDEIHRLVQMSSTSMKGHDTRELLMHIEKQLDEYTQRLYLFRGQYTPAEFHRSHAIETMEFLATRIMAYQHGNEPYHAHRIQQDARMSCLLLLIAHGDQDPAVLYYLHALIRREIPTSKSNHQFRCSPSISLTSVFDAFSVPAFFILSQDLLMSRSRDAPAGMISDLDLLRRVSACYTEYASRMQANTYHQKVAWVFSQLISLMRAVLDAHLDCHSVDSPRAPTQNDLPSPPCWPVVHQSTAPLNWESWLSGASSLALSPLGPVTPLGTWNASTPAMDGEGIIPWPTECGRSPLILANSHNEQVGGAADTCAL
ncbi:hypothetical protein ASPBRDRAFT_58582 [Aspergillus brasiliensis CBS 101740]|uniref:Zn(2)-C6 fungal-type domain-containing protein n=1 Tax=Aspergillus brasiliensis (strain CBS 101740 / IMI 381727 / IBT 21946) TaxID=767769 RepID=A0A1L9U8N8_ASPBC|nr:hypothetical protein ASPBRDRAFT_58582 [Aspergillus brasiliensis CBS 101740]